MNKQTLFSQFLFAPPFLPLPSVTVPIAFLLGKLTPRPFTRGNEGEKTARSLMDTLPREYYSHKLLYCSINDGKLYYHHRGSDWWRCFHALERTISVSLPANGFYTCYEKTQFWKTDFGYLIQCEMFSLTSICSIVSLSKHVLNFECDIRLI